MFDLSLPVMNISISDAGGLRNDLRGEEFREKEKTLTQLLERSWLGQETGSQGAGDPGDEKSTHSSLLLPIIR